MSKFFVLVIIFVIGEGGSGGVLGIGVGNDVCMLEYLVYFVIFLEGFFSILFKDLFKVKEVCDVMKFISNDLYDLKIIDKIIKEFFGGV